MSDVHTVDLSHLANVRVTGVMTDDAHLADSVGREPHALLTLQFQPAQGLPYFARVDLGCDVALRMQAEAELPYLRRGALVSVAGSALELRTDHSRAVLRVVGARDVFIPLDPHPRSQPSTGAATC